MFFYQGITCKPFSLSNPSNIKLKVLKGWSFEDPKGKFISAQQMVGIMPTTSCVLDEDYFEVKK